MKLFCQYSGVNYHLPHFSMAKTSVLTVHPIFHMGKHQLYHLYDSWQEGVITNETDLRLLFLALLNSTDLIDWQHTADPSTATVQQHMSNVYYTCKWVTSVTLPSMKLPKFAVTRDTKKLGNVGNWMGVWEGIRADFEAGYRTTVAIEKQKQREAMLERLIKGADDTARFAGLLAQWAFDAADVPHGIRDYWRQVLTTKGLGIFSIRRVDIDEIVEHFEGALAEHGSIYSYTLLKYVRDIQRQVVTGLGFNITNSNDLVDIVTRSQYSILDSDDVTNTERSNIQKIINSAPSSEPIESNYPNRVAFIRAKISWKMALRAAVTRESAEDILADKLDKLMSKDAENDGIDEDAEPTEEESLV